MVLWGLFKIWDKSWTLLKSWSVSLAISVLRSDFSMNLTDSYYEWWAATMITTMLDLTKLSTFWKWQNEFVFHFHLSAKNCNFLKVSIAGIIVPCLHSQSEWGESINFIEKSDLNVNPQYLLNCRFVLHSSLLALISIQSLEYHSYIT